MIVDPLRYGTPAGFRQYHDERGHTLPPSAADDATVLDWALVASEYIDGVYGGAFPGLKVGQRAQIRQWPREGATDRDGYYIANDSYPDEVVFATYEAMLIEANNPGTLVTSFTPTKYKSVRIEGAVSVDYNVSLNALDLQPQYPLIDRIIAPILTGNGGGAFSPLSGCVSRV